MQVRLDSEEAQVAFGEALGQVLQGRGLVYLEGELGAGKTTLTRGILRAYGHQGAVKSPTYTLVEPYELGSQRIYHLDLYRLSDPEELEFIGGRDVLADDALSIIEWPSRGEGWLPEPDLRLVLEVVDSGRLVSLVAGSDQGERTLASLQRQVSNANKLSNASKIGNASKLSSDQLESGVIQWK
ncbi:MULTISPECIES: tRNA (adenosine(37)-N6)-threonylcarbamoyltransferase complex ATPase subunit type 1 TsaE [unclassified Halomonas]|uniref:tRNA (adenosine(37)-N6)-threonylcarbamoyltransferase complex ATPase subunit type 1 TsaE n=1 Tax=unclassified Halomonas TaxID=2609666 RepID=UPI0007D96168|nr:MULTISPECIES: tRNA (adenosine(37)-N6)-threonylcarbamoyltransferase complex ATPase subunit type 1 TsaE [unclassified Halomonas]MBT2787438.1 tRNA (adenosine(37)-N6)-threonylcarbamoyltransferase complex ATPase subunit type 1 TsaE [Halomonas sp. ISL-106]MBT2796200.1 tRNA (adenosine(37)-N6)-threonylcarbamoyltransferase complex ATPase subunit type 1 TsaE [Halomonas sp. ISL-104]OAL57644.1 tRNA (N6-adenosine(37)-N6)-threonylcarbamoyltransferase complex ATPase TsaE [Halomonas sp. ALS9]